MQTTLKPGSGGRSGQALRPHAAPANTPGADAEFALTPAEPVALSGEHD
ncbi:hypothetical protein [Streptomyces sp. NBC_01408]|nr:hypothetical protein [Streptomyces sp. NBC_01408]MCX4692010.1 hypothetical protein [Streptomyces sp. NBC_01408]